MRLTPPLRHQDGLSAGFPTSLSLQWVFPVFPLHLSHCLMPPWSAASVSTTLVSPGCRRLQGIAPSLLERLGVSCGCRRPERWHYSRRRVRSVIPRLCKSATALSCAAARRTPHERPS